MRKKLVITILILAGIIVAPVVAWKIAFPKFQWHYKMTVSVETPEGLKTGSAVRQIGTHTGPRIGDVGGGGAGVTGEAVVVDLGSRGVLFMLVGEDYGYQAFFEAFPSPMAPLTKEGQKYNSRLKNQKASLLQKNYLSRFVMFMDLNDPMSVKLVDPYNLQASFGEGIGLKDVTIETTDEKDITRIIREYLPWLKTLRGYLHGQNISHGSPLGLGTG